MMTRATTYALSALLAVVLSLQGQPAQAAPESERDDGGYSVLIKVANAAYNDGKYDQAAKGYGQAIQSRPGNPAPYRNLARTYFWQSKYAIAAAHYDMYLRLAAGAEDRKQVQSERRLAASRAGDEVWNTPESQRLALKAMDEQLEQGAAYTEGGGGAWGIYQTLLRTGYAQPELVRIRRRLVRKLLDEFEGVVVPEADQPTPRLDLQAWQLQLDRLDAARQLTRDEAMRGIIERRSALAETGIALLNGQHDEAVVLSSTAMEKNPDMAFVHWFHVSSLIEAGRHEQALMALASLQKKLTDTGSDHVGYAEHLRAMVMQRAGKGEQAADIYLKLVGE